jgi:hypothetical protein
MDKGIIVGVSHETSVRRSLDFSIFRITTNVSLGNLLIRVEKSKADHTLQKTHLFLHHVLRFHLSNSQLSEAILFASHYQHLVYFAHTLEILLHGVLEDEADARGSSPTPGGDDSGTAAASTPGGDVLPRVVDFLDHFPDSMQVVVACARKTEVARWSYLFDVVGKPRDLFEVNRRWVLTFVTGISPTDSQDSCLVPRNVLPPTYSKWRLLICWYCTI